MIELAPGGKRNLALPNPVMPAAGVFGYGDEYARLVRFDLLGALVTNPVTWTPRPPASGPRVVSLTGGMLLHTGLPNPGMSRVIRQHTRTWAACPVPVIVHVVATAPAEVYKCCAALDAVESVAGIELGMGDQATPDDIAAALDQAAAATALPVIARLPLLRAPELALAAQEAGACALTVGAPPRGTARDPLTGRLVGGRLYGPWVKALALRAVGQAAQRVNVPVIGAGGVHSRQDARDLLDAGAAAVQVDAAVWVRPKLIEDIASELGGLDATRVTGAWSDEW